MYEDYFYDENESDYAGTYAHDIEGIASGFRYLGNCSEMEPQSMPTWL